MILNLALNARDAMVEGGTLRIETENVAAVPGAGPGVGDDARLEVQLTVADTGTGFDAEGRQRLFEPFYTTKSEGGGLGLAAVYAIVEQSGGVIELDSAPNRGSVFVIRFPLDLESPELEVARPAGPPAATGETIMLVEDQEPVRRFARLVLENHGYVVIEAESPDGALALVSRHDGPIDLLLTDVVMPGMSGPQLAVELTARRSGLRTLFMSGYSAEAIAEHDVEDAWAGVDFLPKPFSVEGLVDKGSAASSTPEQSSRRPSAELPNVSRRAVVG